MTDREKAVVMAYTGVCMLANDKMGLFYQYVQDKLGRCVMTHELAYPEVQDAIKEASHDDFIELCLSSDEPRVMTLEEVKQFVFGAPYIIETNEPDNESRMMYGLYSHQGLEGNFDFAVTDMRKRLFDIDYGKTWRCWTSRPTYEQRKAVKWDE